MNGDNQQLPPDHDQAGGNWQFKPGTDIVPQDTQQPLSNQPQPPLAPTSSATGPTSAAIPLSSTPTTPKAGMPDLEVSWTASEYISHNKSVSWYILLALAVAAISALAFLITRDILSTAIIVIIAGAVGVNAAQKPNVLSYHLGPQGLAVDNKFYPYSQFKSFLIMDEGAFSSIMFIPLKRIKPPLNIYYDPEDEERIIAAVSTHLPLEAHSKHEKHDVMESLARRLRF